MIKFFKIMGKYYTTALEIENYAGTLGVKIRYDNRGIRHPGTRCTNTLNSIMKTKALKDKFKLTKECCIQLDVEESSNVVIIEDMIMNEYINSRQVRLGILDLYSYEACNAILASMLRDANYKLPSNAVERIAIYGNMKVKITPKILSGKWAKRANTLLSKRFGDVVEVTEKGVTAIQSVISSFPPHEQEIIRKYQRIVKQTRENGRAYVSRRSL